MAKTRLSADSWVDAGLNTLETHGDTALRAESLARDLGTTKGSFYWHFKGLPDFHQHVAAAWKRRAAAALVAALESDASVAARLQAIAEGAPAEPAMRAWARDSDIATRELEEIDRLRLGAMAALLRDIGISNPEIARALYAAGIGLQALPPDDGDDARAMATLVDLVLALR